MRLNLLSKILLWVFVNLLVLGVVLSFIFNLQLNFAPTSPLLGAMSERIEIIAELIASESAQKTADERDEILQRYSQTYGVEFTIFTNQGEQLGGKPLELPEKIIDDLSVELTRPEGMPDNVALTPPPQRVSLDRTTSPTVYWAIARVPIIEPGKQEPLKAAVVAYSDSFTGNGLFFNPKPWITTILIIFGLSALVWFPFIRSLTKSISKLNSAAEQIAGENFNVRIDDKRRDEIGGLGKSVNNLSEKLSAFVYGQKRFLGDISHELNSPLARMGWALSLLESKTEVANQKYIDSVREEIELMTNLVNELLAYSKAGMKSGKVETENINLRSISEQAIKREKFANADINIEITDDLSVNANRELLSKALSNVLRNAVLYAGETGEIKLHAAAKNETVILKITDSGSGVPEDQIGKIFDPLYRVQKDRARKTGGSGLGLAIVKACIEACDGTVKASNLKPKGFEISFILNTPNTAPTSSRKK
jgi:two-component system, OmpR family, sensor histidine kinase CpxA